MRDYDRITCHRDGSVTVWDCYAQAWDRTRYVSDRVLASLSREQRDRVMRHLSRAAEMRLTVPEYLRA